VTGEGATPHKTKALGTRSHGVSVGKGQEAKGLRQSPKVPKPMSEATKPQRGPPRGAERDESVNALLAKPRWRRLANEDPHEKAYNQRRDERLG
jgi:hypothetical protein